MIRMSDGAISQDEIDALLSGVSVDGLNASGRVGSAPSVQVDTAVLQKFADELKTPLAENLNKMTGANFSADTPVVEQLDRDRLLAKLPEVVVNILADFSSGLSGDHLYILAPEFAQKIVGLMNREDNADIDDMALSVIAETVSTHTNDEIQALEKTGKLSGISCNPPTARNDPKAMIRVPQNQFILFNYPLSLDGQGYTLWEAVGATAAEQMIKALGSGNSVPEMSMGGTLSAADIASVGTMASPGMNMGSGAEYEYGTVDAHDGPDGKRHSERTIAAIPDAPRQYGRKRRAGQYRSYHGRIHGDDRRARPHEKTDQRHSRYGRRNDHRAR